MPTAPPSPKAPLLGVSIAIWRDDLVLLIQRGKEPMAGKWSFPGGSVEFGERLKEAALREAREETGLHLTQADFVRFIEIFIGEDRTRPQRHIVLGLFAARWRAGEPRAASDARAAEFVTLDELSRREVTPGLERYALQSREFLLAAQKRDAQNRDAQDKPQPEPPASPAPAKIISCLTGVIAPLALALALGLTGPGLAQTPPERPSVEAREPPYQKKLERFSEILGALHHLRPLCLAAEGGIWRQEMARLVETEGSTPERRDRLVAAFNRGFSAVAQTHRTCTAATVLVAERYRAEAMQLADDIASRFVD